MKTFTHNIFKNILVSIIQFSILSILFWTPAHAAKVIDLRKNQPASAAQIVVQELNQPAPTKQIVRHGLHQSAPANRAIPNPVTFSADKILGMRDDNRIVELKRNQQQQNRSIVRYQQTFKDIPIWGKQIIIHHNPGNGRTRGYGQKVEGIESDTPINNALFANFDTTQALEKAKEIHIQEYGTANWYYKNVVNQKVIYIDSSNRAILAYEVNFFVDSDQGDPARPHFIFDGQTGEILKQWNGLTHAQGSGPGGNLKTGQYEYGVDFDHLDVQQNGSTYTFINTNVKTVNLNHETSGNTAFSYTGPRNTFKQINGAYSPINDAHFFGGVVFNMYQAWYNTAPLTFQLVMKVHYGNNVDNAYWTGDSMLFGDGANRFYPLVSLDIVSHEVSHGFTQQNSGLIYNGQSGGINEAFSDIAGEAAEFYLNGSTDYESGATIFKQPNAAGRYLHDPPRDGRSIDHVDDYWEGLDVHYSSGIFNKAFYLLATTAGWDTRRAFDVFIKANQDYWTPSTDFTDGANGVMDAASDLGYSTYDVYNAFLQVGITTDKIPLSLAIPESATEEDGVLVNQGIITVSTPQPNNLVINLSSDDTSEVTVPSEVAILAGQQSVRFNITIIDDADLDGTQFARITASSEIYATTTATILVNDSETATLSLTIPENANESDGVLTNQGLLRVSRPVDADITATLSSSNSNKVTVPAAITIPSGQDTVSFDLTIIDNTLIDNTLPTTITASVTRWTNGSDAILVEDNDRRILLNLPEKVSEGYGIGVRAGTVSIAGTFSSDLVIELSSNDTSEITVPATIIIPSGQTSATFDLTIVDDEMLDEDQTAVITAQAPGWPPNTATIVIAEGYRKGSEFQVNTDTDSFQWGPSVTGLQNGNFIVTWGSLRNGNYDVYGQMFSSSRDKIGTEFMVNTYTNSEQANPNINGLENGGFIITWRSNGQDGYGMGIYGQIFNNLGNKTGPEFQVNTYTENWQSNQSITGLEDGSFIITWQSSGQDGDGSGIFGQIFNNSGDKIGPEFQVNAYTNAGQLNPSVAGLENGGFIITWESSGQDGYSLGIFGQMFDNSGDKIGPEFQANTYIWNNQSAPSVVGLKNGNFIISWISYNQDGDGSGIFGQMFDSSGNRIGAEFQANTSTEDDQGRQNATKLENGGFVVTWKSIWHDGNSYGIFGQMFDSSGNKMGSEFQVNTYNNNYNEYSVVAGLKNGDFIVNWRSNDTNNNSCIYGQIFVTDTDSDFLADSLEDSGCTSPVHEDTDNDGILDGVEDANQNGVIDPGETSPCDPDSDGDGIIDSVEDTNQNGVIDPGETDPTNEDTDGDGLPDGWEVDNGLDPLDATGENNGTADIDQDNYSNLEEFCSGTDPGNADSVPVHPTADAGPTQEGREGTIITLSGLNSKSPVGTISSYIWTQTQGISVTISDPTAAQPTFLAPDVGLDGESLTFSLMVMNDCGIESQTTGTCIVNITWQNAPPIANAGSAQIADEGDRVTLDATASTDPDDGIYSYSWSQIGQPLVALYNSTTANPYFTAPDVGPAGVTLTFELIVTDQGGLQNSDICQVNITWINVPPIADAGQNQVVTEGDTVTLNGENSVFIDDAIVGYLWTQTNGSPPVTLSDPTAVNPTFLTSPVDADNSEMTFRLTVTDSGGLSNSDEVSITVQDNGINDFANDVLPVASYSGDYIGMKEDTGGRCVLLDSIDPATIPDNTNRPKNLIYGLLNINIRPDTVGGTVKLAIHLPEPAPDNFTWIKYSPTQGWIDFRSNITFNADRDQVTLILVDGGPGDDDGIANGIIIDPSGLGIAAVASPPSPSGGDSGGGGGGCFIATAADGSIIATQVKVLQNFYDIFLLTNSLGTAFTQLYYTYSPSIADHIAEHFFLRKIIRWSLLPLVGMAWVTIHLGPGVAFVLFFLLSGLFILLTTVLKRKLWPASRSFKANRHAFF